MTEKIVRTTLACLAMLLATAASAHDGHGAAGTHLHATDVFGLLALAAGVAWWISRRSGR